MPQADSPLPVPPKPRLETRLREAIRLRQMSQRTEQAYGRRDGAGLRISLFFLVPKGIFGARASEAGWQEAVYARRVAGRIFQLTR